MGQYPTDHPRLFERRDRDVNDLDLGIVKHRLDGLKHLGHTSQTRDRLGGRPGPRGQTNYPEPGVGIGDEMAIADDEPGADDADPSLEVGG